MPLDDVNSFWEALSLPGAVLYGWVGGLLAGIWSLAGAPPDVIDRVRDPIAADDGNLLMVSWIVTGAVLAIVLFPARIFGWKSMPARVVYEMLLAELVLSFSAYLQIRRADGDEVGANAPVFVFDQDRNADGIGAWVALIFGIAVALIVAVVLAVVYVSSASWIPRLQHPDLTSVDEDELMYFAGWRAPLFVVMPFVSPWGAFVAVVATMLVGAGLRLSVGSLVMRAWESRARRRFESVGLEV